MWTELDKKKKILALSVSKFQKEMSMLSNVSGTFSIQIAEVKITKPNLPELIDETIQVLRRYMPGEREDPKMRKERIAEEVSEIKLNILIAKNQAVKVKGKFM